MARFAFSLVSLAVLWAQGVAYSVPTPQISLLQPQGIRFAVPTSPGISLVAYHYSIGSPLYKTDAGQYNVDVTYATGGYWVHQNTRVSAAGKTVYYWVLVAYNGGRYLLSEQWWSDASCARYPCDAACDMSVMPCNGLLFEDTFDTLNLDVWEHEITAGGGGNWEFQYYTNNRSNSYVRDNTLFLKPTLTTDKFTESFITSGTLDLWGASPADLCTGNAFYGCQRTGSASNAINPVQSARLRTVNSFAFRYGKVEVVAKMPTGDWLWPAIWLLPKRNSYGGWPASGEIDIVESRGNLKLFDENGVNVGVNQMGSTMHWGPFPPLNGWHRTHATKNLDSGHFGMDFHKYVLEWTSTGLKTYVDDELLLGVDPGTGGFWELGQFETDNPGIQNPWTGSTSKMAPFDQEFYIILNVAVGGTNYFSDNLNNTDYPKPWLNSSPTASLDFWSAKALWYPTWNPNVTMGEDAAMQVKSVRVWAV